MTPVQHVRHLTAALFSLLLTLVFLPRAQAQGGGNALNATFDATSRLPTLLSQPVEPHFHWERRKPLEDRAPKKFVLMSAVVYTGAFLDMQESVSLRPHFHEHDPLARPFTHLPVPAYYAAGGVLATGVNFLAWSMARSHRLHRFWWLAPLCSISGNMTGYAYTKMHEHVR